MKTNHTIIFYHFKDKLNGYLAIATGLQYVIKFGILLSLVLLLANLAQFPPEEKYNFIALTLIFAAISTLLQTSNRLGAGMLFPSIISVPYYAPILIATQHYGWSYALGMTFVGHIVQLALVPLLKKLRFSSEITIALIIFSMALWLSELGFKQIIHNDQLGQLILYSKQEIFPTHIIFNSYEIAIGVFSLSSMFIFWRCKYRLIRMLSLFLSMIIGYILVLLHLSIPKEVVQLIHHAPLFTTPQFRWYSFNFSWQLLPSFLVAALISAFEIVALIRLYDQQTDPKLTKESSYKKANRYNLLTSIINMITTVFGVPPTAPVPGAISTSLLTGVISRRTAYSYCAILLLLSFSPKCIFFMLTVPATVNGAALIIMGFILIRYSLLLFHQQKIFNKKYHDIAKQKILAIALTVNFLTYILPSQYQQKIYQLGLTNPGLVFSLLTYLVLTALLASSQNKETSL